MKTHDEIKKGLTWCIEGAYCEGCPYEDDCYVNLNNIPMVKDGRAYIQQLEANWSQVSKVLCGKENATLDEVLQAVSQLKKQLQAYEESAIKCCYESRCNKEINALNEYCARVDKEMEAVKRERDAAVYALESIATGRESKCSHCVHSSDRDCFVCWGERWQWRGVRPENTEVQEEVSEND
jgi:hypothetical protein